MESFVCSIFFPSYQTSGYTAKCQEAQFLSIAESEPMSTKPCKCAFLFPLFSPPPPPPHAFSSFRPQISSQQPRWYSAQDGLFSTTA